VPDIVSYRPNAIELRAASDNSSFLLLSELFYPGWRATVDERPAPILRADYLLRSIPLPAGEHRSRLVFAPESLQLGAPVSVSTLGVLAVARVRARRKRAKTA
jgi:uncharacterized membrane protein YfhO